MGVTGWNWWLRQTSWLPEHKVTSSASIWRDDSVTDGTYADRIENLPPGSVLHVDGYGLAFRLFSAAYERHLISVLGKSRKLTRKMSADKARDALPCYMPLELLTEQVNEFCDRLSMYTIKCYFDGSERVVFKKETDVKRQERFEDSWTAMRRYCDDGILHKDISEWPDVYPRSRLTFHQVKHALLKRGIELIECEQEADAVIAKEARDTGNGTMHYVLGDDSDFCFFDAAYVSLENLNVSGDGMANAVVMRRSSLASSMGIYPKLMVECALLLGNDYVKGIAVDGAFFKPDTALAFLHEQDEDYQVSPRDDIHDQGLAYSRSLYNLQDPCICEDTSEPIVETYDQEDLQNLHSSRLRIPQTCHPDIAVMDVTQDASIKDAVIRALDVYIELERNPECMLTNKHLLMFLGTTLPCPNEMSTQSGSSWRPSWQDITASYLIEKLIVHSLDKSRVSVRILTHYAPSEIFNQYSFHRVMSVITGEPEINGEQALVDLENEESGNDVPTPRVVLPVDKHEQEILDSVNKNRITVIQGETGCGKSSRIPVMLLNAPSQNPLEREAKLYISQPRRIAAKALVERIRDTEPELKDAIALRMGHGVREYETNQTRAWFVTTGYLVRLLANYPGHFQNISYLIVDEVHERSVDSDVLCLLCRRLLHTNPHIRLVVMSATLASDMYREYFDVKQEPIKVGAKRFPISHFYLDDMIENLGMAGKDRKMIETHLAECTKGKCKASPSQTFIERLCSMAVKVAMRIGKPGSAVLIFCAGMNEIVAISEEIDSMVVPGVHHTCYVIHSDIPFEDQMKVFDPAAPDEVKIIVATNAAESSLTLPDVDHVICLGLCKQIVYNELSHRQMLQATWISKASATQRSGRTGRVRPGMVYRLYSRENFEKDMMEFEPGEILRTPLDSVILALKGMLAEESVTDVLLECIEPPSLQTIDRSFESLYEWNFISAPEDDCHVTSLGSFASHLGIDLQLGAAVGLGVQFGIAAEVIQQVAILSFPKTPWIMSNPLIHAPHEFNDMASKVYLSKCHYDANMMSDSFAAMNLVWEFEKEKQNHKAWCWSRSVAYVRIRRLSLTAGNLRKRVADFLKISPSSLTMTRPPSEMPHGKVTLLRIVQAWVFRDSMIQMNPPKKILSSVSENFFTMKLNPNSDQISDKHLEQVLSKTRHMYELQGYSERTLTGHFQRSCGEFQFDDTELDAEERFISLTMELSADIGWIQRKNQLRFYLVNPERDQQSICETIRKQGGDITASFVSLEPAQARGRGERRAGRWNANVVSDASGTSQKFVGRFIVTELSKKQMKSVVKYLEQRVRDGSLPSGLSWNLTVSSKHESVPFQVVTRGQCGHLANQDLKDLFASAHVDCKENAMRDDQSIRFPFTESSPVWSKGTETEDTSWDRAIVQNIPEGARLLGVLLSSRRKESIVKFAPSDDDSTSEEEVVMRVSASQFNAVTFRWKRLNSDNNVFVSENCVPASAVHMKKEPLYCCCANALELKSGGLRVDGITLLPPGRRFFFLCRITFGLYDRDASIDSIHEKCMRWVFNNLDEYDRSKIATLMSDFSVRLQNAIEFEQGARTMGEELVCFPDKVRQLLAIFDGLDGHESSIWDDFDDNPLLPANLPNQQRKEKQWQRDAAEISQSMKNSTQTGASKPRSRKTQYQRPPESTDEPANNTQANSNDGSEPKTTKTARKKNVVLEEIPQFSVEGISKLLSSTMDENESTSEDSMYMTNILALLINHFREMLPAKNRCYKLPLNETDFKVCRTTVNDTHYFTAEFYNHIIKTAPRKKGSKYNPVKLPAWLLKNLSRPNTMVDAQGCLPEHFRTVLKNEALEARADGDHVFLFKDPAMALQMAAAFWLDKNFYTGKLHWYEQKMAVLVGQMRVRAKN